MQEVPYTQMSSVLSVFVSPMKVAWVQLTQLETYEYCTVIGF